MKIISLVAISLSLNAFAGQRATEAELEAKRGLALQMASLFRCDSKLDLGILDTFDFPNGNVMILVIESSNAQTSPSGYGIEYMRSVHFNKVGDDHAKAKEIRLTACDKMLSDK